MNCCYNFIQFIFILNIFLEFYGNCFDIAEDYEKDEQPDKGEKTHEKFYSI